MRAVIQKVASASATHAGSGEIISSIGKGLCVLVGISKDDTRKDLEYIVNKILNLKLFEDDSDETGTTKKWKKSVKDSQYEILCLSQITLYHSLKGNKLDFHHAMPPSLSKTFYADFISEMKSRYTPELIKEGSFGEHLIIGIQNDGPVTITLESPKKTENQDFQEQTVPDMDDK